MWNRFVDFVTVIWLGTFFMNLAYPHPILGSIEIGLLGVFVADLVVKLRAAADLKTFLRERWSDILMVIPYFRIFRILRFTRLLRILRASRIARVGKFPGLKTLEAFRRKVIRVAKRIGRHGNGAGPSPG